MSEQSSNSPESELDEFVENFKKLGLALGGVKQNANTAKELQEIGDKTGTIFDRVKYLLSRTKLEDPLAVNVTEFLLEIHCLYARIYNNLFNILLNSNMIDPALQFSQQAHNKMYVDKEVTTDGSVDVNSVLYGNDDDAVILFLIDFAKLFEKIKANDEEKQGTIYRKRTQIYQQTIPLLNSRREKINKKVEEMKSSSQDINQFLVEDKRLEMQLLNTHRRYGQALFYLKDYEQSLIWLRKCVEHFEGSISKLDDAEIDSDSIESILDYCTSVLEMTEVMKVLKRDAESLTNYLSVLGIFDIINQKQQNKQATPAVSSLQIAGVCNNIAMSYYHQFEYSQTLPYFQRALDIYRAHYGDDVPAVKLIQGNIATNRQMAALTQQLTSQGINIQKMDFTNRRELTHEEEQRKYFTSPTSGNTQI